jgi:catechol 2,3-dioxygenase-like lactoylglutathione lyase family enzyme
MSRTGWLLIFACALGTSCDRTRATLGRAAAGRTETSMLGGRAGRGNTGLNAEGGRAGTGAAPPMATSGSGSGGLLGGGPGGAESSPGGNARGGGLVSVAGDTAAGAIAGTPATAGRAAAGDAATGDTGGAEGGADSGSALTPQQIKDALAQPQQTFRFHHVHLNSIDPTGSVAFYVSHFKATDLGLPSSSQAVRSADHWLIFDQVASPPPWELTSPIFHIGFGVNDVQKDYDSLVAAGVVSETPPLNSGARLCTGNGTTPTAAFLYGPDREVFEINVASAPDLRHVHFLSDDPIAAGQFFVNHLGVSSTTPNPSSAATSCMGVQVNPIYGATLDGITFYWYPTGFGRGYYPDIWTGKAEFDSPRGRALDHIAFSVDDLDRAVLRLRAEGVTLLQSAKTTLDGQLRSAFVEGPDRLEIEIVEGHVGG